MRKVVLVLILVLMGALPALSGCQSTASVGPREAADDLVPAPGLGPAYRANIQQQGIRNPWPPIESTEVTLGIATEIARVSYRDHIETKAGETRNNIFTVLLPDVRVEDLPSITMEVDLSAPDLPRGITITQTGQYHGPSRGTWNKTFLAIRISSDVAPGQYAFDVNVKINGKDYGEVPVTIRVIE